MRTESRRRGAGVELRSADCQCRTDLPVARLPFDHSIVPGSESVSGPVASVAPGPDILDTFQQGTASMDGPFFAHNQQERGELFGAMLNKLLKLMNGCALSQDNAIGNDYLKDFFNETNETLLSELAAILKYLVAVLFLVTDSSESLLIVLQRIVSPAQNTISETLTLKNEEKGGNNLPAWESLIDTLNAFASDSEQSNPPFTESQALAPIPVFDRMTDILFGLGLTTEPDAPAVATAWQKVITAKVVDPHSWLSSFILSQDCLVVFSLLADLGEDDIADITARNRVLLRQFLSACLYARAECTSCSYPPLSAEQIARKESLEHLMKGLQS